MASYLHQFYALVEKDSFFGALLNSTKAYKKEQFFFNGQLALFWCMKNANSMHILIGLGIEFLYSPNHKTF